MRGLRFQRRFGHSPARINLSKHGLSSLSFGRRGMWLTIGRVNMATLGWPGSGVRYSRPLASKSRGAGDPGLWKFLAVVAVYALASWLAR
jgi:hypothetical protein